jgi:hypothetical protein
MDCGSPWYYFSSEGIGPCNIVKLSVSASTPTMFNASSMPAKMRTTWFCRHMSNASKLAKSRGAEDVHSRTTGPYLLC